MRESDAALKDAIDGMGVVARELVAVAVGSMEVDEVSNSGVKGAILVSSGNDEIILIEPSSSFWLRSSSG